MAVNNISINSKSSKSVSEVLSAFDQLPPQLTWKIIDYVPESVLDLMLVSCTQQFYLCDNLVRDKVPRL